MRTIKTRQDAIDLAKEELEHLATIKNDPAATQHFLNTLQAERLILEMISLRHSTR